jgi:hypothetical protein
VLFLHPQIFFHPEIYSSDFSTPLPEMVRSPHKYIVQQLCLQPLRSTGGQVDCDVAD